MKGFVLMALAMTAYFIREIWTLWKFRREIFYPYPFAPDQYNYVQTYWAMYAGYAFIAMLTMILWLEIRSNRPFWFCIFVLAIAEMIEYLLNYNLPWGVMKFDNFEVNVNVTTFRYVILPIIFSYQMFKSWKR